MSEPDPPPGAPVVVTEVAPAATAALVEAAAAGTAGATGPAAVGLSAAATEKLVDAAVLATPPKPPATPAEETERAKMTAGQRTTSMAWEVVKAVVAILFTVVTLWVTAHLALRGEATQALAALVFLTTSCSAILHTYMATVNHTKVGGVGDKTERER